MAATRTAKAFRRRVFYIPGYDPFPARRYRELYRSESVRQAAISAYRIELTGLAGDPARWIVRGDFGGIETEAGVEVLGWSDIVRRSMTGGVAGAYLALCRTVRLYLGTGTYLRLARLRKGPALAGLYPVAMLLLQVAVAAVAALAVQGALSAIHPTAAWGAGGAAFVLVLAAFRRADRVLFAHYLMHDYAFTASAGGAVPDQLAPRLAEFRRSVAAALASDADEVLLVGHSSGAELAVRVAAELLRSGAVRGGGAAFGLLTLGQSIPVVSCLPGAGSLRADLAALSESELLTWVDVSAPGDGCAFALCDPVAVSGVGGPDQRWPLIVSAAFRQTLDPDRWRRLRWRFFRLHFQYLCAFDRPGRYDYFAITAGPWTLARRFEGQRPSPARIDRVAA